MKHALLIFSTLFLFTATITAQKRENLPPCRDHHSFYKTTVTLQIKVEPSANMEWTFPEAPSIIAKRILSSLNDNVWLIKFKEANGSIPDYIIHITVAEKMKSGTRRDQAVAELIGPPEGMRLGDPGSYGQIIVDTSCPGRHAYYGEVDDVIEQLWETETYTNLTDAVNHLSENLAIRFYRGWFDSRLCVQTDGSVRKKSN